MWIIDSYLNRMSIKQLWLLFKIYIITIISFFVIGIFLCFSWLSIIIAVVGITIAILWYRSARNHLRKKGVIE